MSAIDNSKIAEYIQVLEQAGYSVTKKRDIETVPDWVKYLESLNDETGFNLEVTATIRYVLARSYGPFHDVNRIDINYLRKQVKELLLDFDTMKAYFGIKKRKDINTIDLTKYRIEPEE